MALRVVITDLGYASYETERDVLRVAGDVDLVLATCGTEAEVTEACRDADGVITRLAPVGEAAIRGMRRCRVISRYGVGVDNVNVVAATTANIPVCNVRGYCDEEVSDHALALLLSCARRIVSRDRHVRAGHWDIGAKEPIHRIAGRTLGLVGYGAIPRALHRKVSGLGLARVLVYDPYITDELATGAGVTRVDLDTLFGESDFVSVHAPLTAQTRHLVGEPQISRMKPTAILINTSRGPVVDTRALREALRRGAIHSAGVDVYDPEPPARHDPLLAEPHAVLTDHTAWYSEESQLELQRSAARNVALVLTGSPPLSCVNPEVLGSVSA